MHLKLYGIWLAGGAFPYCSFGFWPKSLIIGLFTEAQRLVSSPALTFCFQPDAPGLSGREHLRSPCLRPARAGISHLPGAWAAHDASVHLGRMPCPAHLPSLATWCSCEDRWDPRVAGSDRIGIAMPRSEAASLSVHRCSSEPALQHKV